MARAARAPGTSTTAPARACGASGHRRRRRSRGRRTRPPTCWPSKTSLSEPPHRRARDLQELLQALRGLAGEAEADDPAAACVKRLEVALGLSGLERREAVRDSRDGEVV